MASTRMAPRPVLTLVLLLLALLLLIRGTPGAARQIAPDSFRAERYGIVPARDFALPGAGASVGPRDTIALSPRGLSDTPLLRARIAGVDVRVPLVAPPGSRHP